MTDLALLDQIMDIITRVPSAHEQLLYGAELEEYAQRAVKAELADNPDLEDVVDCTTAYCVAGWVLHLRGYGYQAPYFSYPPGHPSAGMHVRDSGMEAARILGLDYAEVMGYRHGTGMGIFHSFNSLQDIEDWMSYYHGQITLADCLARCHARQLARRRAQ